MKQISRIILSATFAVFAFTTAQAQTGESEKSDSIFVKIDSERTNIIGELQSNYDAGRIKIKQSNAISQALENHASSNLKNQKIYGWRICIYSDNKQNARAISNSIKASFNAKYPNIPSYRDYRNPYFQVYVGDFRTKDEAEKFKKQINDMYPRSWITQKMKINLPPI